MQSQIIEKASDTEVKITTTASPLVEVVPLSSLKTKSEAYATRIASDTAAKAIVDAQIAKAESLGVVSTAAEAL